MRINWDNIQVIAIWVFGSLLAIAIISNQPYFGIAVAVLAGVAVGITHLLTFDKAQGKADRDDEQKEPANQIGDQTRLTG